MNKREEIEKRFNERFLEDFGWWKCISPLATMREIKSFFFDEILPEVLRDMIDKKIWVPNTKDDMLNSYIEGQRDYKELLQKQAKEKYNIAL